MKQLYHYHVWANERMLTHISLYPDVFTKPVVGPFPSIARTFGHMYDVDRLWFSRMKEDSKPVIEETAFWNVEEAKEAFNELHKEMKAFLTAEMDEDKSIYYTDSKGAAFQNTLSELVTHVVNHGTSHRGNIVVMLREAGYKSCPTDFIYFLRESTQ